MKLKTILQNVEVTNVTNNNNPIVKNLSCDHRNVEKNGIFFCIKGNNADGHNFAQEAVNRGAICLVVEHFIQNINVCQVVVKNTRIAMSIMAKNLSGKACDKLKIITLVGTNGKTTTSYIISHILTQQGINNAIIGTNGTHIGAITINSTLTTPDPIELHAIFKQLIKYGVEVVILEASAQAIYLNKLAGITSFASVFTNLSNEHLDYFKTYENYKQVKVGYFNTDVTKRAVINADDVVGQEIIKTCKLKVYSYGLYNPADTFAIDITTSLKGSTFIVNANDEIFEVKTKLIGIYNIYNILASINVALLINCTIDTIMNSLSSLESIPGRMNIINLDCNNKVVIDYAHTPDGFEQVLGLLRKLRRGNIIVVFGCVGYSDS